MKIPKMTYLLPSGNDYAPADRRSLDMAMRLCRDPSKHSDTVVFTYGKYFHGITEGIAGQGFRPLVEAVSKNLGKEICHADIEEIRVFAEKHGSDYHPARIAVRVEEKWVSFVMNVAVAERGKARLANEFNVLQYLSGKYDFFLLPKVYWQGEVLIRADASGGREHRLCMFLADWFQGYHEFHLSVDGRDGAQRLEVWEGRRAGRYLAGPQEREVYAQIARIMTLYYDIETFEQIFPWHHAAGDFVIKTENDSVSVKLITARQYASMIDPASEISVHDALLLFLLNLSIRTRLDRLDGVGALAWAGDVCVQATVKGFLEGLKVKEQRDPKMAGLVDGFFRHAGSLAKEDLSDMCHVLVGACDPDAPDMPLLMSHLQAHVSTFQNALRQMAVPALRNG
jgi:hypothetical protein